MTVTVFEQDIEIALIGSKLELENAKIITSRIPEVINLVNQTSLTELKNILASVDLYIGNDSGPTHIAKRE